MPDIAKHINLKASLGTGKPPTKDQIDKINRFALVELTPDQVYVRRFLLAHNGIDRDNERFNEDLLDNFALTLPGKGFSVEGHPSSYGGKGGPAKGRFFDASTEIITPEIFQSLTGEENNLPPDITEVKVLWGDAYLLKLPSNSDTIAQIDGGIYSFVSIGFRAPRFDVTDDRGNNIYGEYRPKGEALEGSLVWLGAQPGASAMKNLDKYIVDIVLENINKNGTLKQTQSKIQEGGEKNMKEFLKNLSDKLGKVFSEDKAADEIVAVIKEKDSEIEALKPLAEDGKTYREDLVQSALKCGALTGDVPVDGEAQKKEETFIKSWPLDKIKDLKEKYELKARKMFPENFTFQSKDEADKQKAAHDAEKNQTTNKKKDYTDPKQNELLDVQ